MQERPITLHLHEVRAILDGSQTMFRRAMEPQPTLELSGIYTWERTAWDEARALISDLAPVAKCPYGEPGDRLLFADGDGVTYALEITAVRVERLQEISEDDAVAEGIKEKWTCLNPGLGSYARGNNTLDDFQSLWDSINGKQSGRSWADNPWVWGVEFTRVEG